MFVKSVCLIHVLLSATLIFSLLTSSSSSYYSSSFFCLGGRVEEPGFHMVTWYMPPFLPGLDIIRHRILQTSSDLIIRHH